MEIEFISRAAAAIPPEMVTVMGYLVSSGAVGWFFKWWKEDIEFKQKTTLDIAQIAERMEMPRGLDLAPKLREEFKNKKWFKKRGEIK